MKNPVFIQKPKMPEGNYNPIPNILWVSDLKYEDKVMLGYLCSHKDMQPVNNIFIANALNVSRKFVGDSLKRLEAKGLIKKENRKYTIFLDKLTCNPKLQLNVTQSYINNNTIQKEKEKQKDFETVTQSYTSKEKQENLENVTLGYISQDSVTRIGCEATREIVEDTFEEIDYSNGINND